MSKYHNGLTVTERSRNSQRTGIHSAMSSGTSFYSQTNQILGVFSVEYISETAHCKRYHRQCRAIANNVEEVQLLVKQECCKRGERFIEFIGTPAFIGKDRTWMTLGKLANKLGPRLTDEVAYVDHRLRETAAANP